MSGVVESIHDDYRMYLHKSRYARYMSDRDRREDWEETVARYIAFFVNEVSDLEDIDLDEFAVLADAIKNMDVMPSMRAMMTAGEALSRDHVAGYNCSYQAMTGRGNEITIDMPGPYESITITMKDPVAFDELAYILMCGTGVGFSVERQYIANLPTVGKPLSRHLYSRHGDNYPGVESEELSTYDTKNNTIHVADSKYGWASALRILIVELYNGNYSCTWDTTAVRPAGERLKTFGGRSSGPEPLEDLFQFTVETFKEAKGRKLTSLEVHDVVCKIADIVVVGGVRRSALISLSNLTDERMRGAKSGQWWEDNGQRALANNSVCYTEKPGIGIFLREWSTLYESKAGERGIFYRGAARNAAAKSGRRDTDYSFGTNPCSEIILRDRQFCNLSEVVVRPSDTLEQLKEKVRLATILGTLQSTLTDFKYLSKEWRENCEEERLLGVSLTGIMDHPVLSGSIVPNTLAKAGGFEGEFDNKELLPFILKRLKEVAIETNREWANKLGVNQSTAITCVKPSGTVSQLVDSASGIHPRYAPYYIRTVRADIKDPLTSFLIEQGVPNEPAIGKEGSTVIFSFPIKAPEGSVMRDDMTAIEQLELWKIYQDHWCEHKPSITVYVREEEWLEVGAWVYKHFEQVSGVAFLPHSDHAYRQAPYQEITEEEYNVLKNSMPVIKWEEFREYSDNTTGSQELACSASGGCDVI